MIGAEDMIDAEDIYIERCTERGGWHVRHVSASDKHELNARCSSYIRPLYKQAMALTLCMQPRRTDLVQVCKTPGCSKRDADPGRPQQLCPARLHGWRGRPVLVKVVPQ